MCTNSIPHPDVDQDPDSDPDKLCPRTCTYLEVVHYQTGIKWEKRQVQDFF